MLDKTRTIYNCVSCEFFEWIPPGNQGECRRYPPQGDKWPHVYPDNWCGEYVKITPGRRDR